MPTLPDELLHACPSGHLKFKGSLLGTCVHCEPFCPTSHGAHNPHAGHKTISRGRATPASKENARRKQTHGYQPQTFTCSFPNDLMPWVLKLKQTDAQGRQVTCSCNSVGPPTRIAILRETGETAKPGVFQRWSHLHYMVSYSHSTSMNSKMSNFYCFFSVFKQTFQKF